MLRKKNTLFWESEPRNDSEVTLSVGTVLPGNTQFDNPLTLQEAESLALKK